MKHLLLSILLLLSLSGGIYAQRTPNPKSKLTELDLSPEQKLAIQVAILEYRQNDRTRRQQLHEKLRQILTRQQQAMVMHWRGVHR